MSFDVVLDFLTLDERPAHETYVGIPHDLHRWILQITQKNHPLFLPWEKRHNALFVQLGIHDQIKRKFDEIDTLLCDDVNRYSSERYLIDLRPGGLMFHYGPLVLFSGLFPEIAERVGLQIPRPDDARFRHLWTVVESATPFAAIMDDLMEISRSSAESSEFIAYIRRTGQVFVDAARRAAPSSAVDLEAIDAKGSLFDKEHFLYYVWILRWMLDHIHDTHEDDRAGAEIAAQWVGRFVHGVCELARGYLLEHELYDATNDMGVFSADELVEWRARTSDMEIAYAVVGLMLNLELDDERFDRFFPFGVFKKTEVLTGILNDLIFAKKDEVHYEKVKGLTGLSPSEQRQVEMFEKRYLVTKRLVDEKLMTKVIDDAVAAVRTTYEASKNERIGAYAAICLMMAHACNVWQLTVSRYSIYHHQHA